MTTFLAALAGIGTYRAVKHYLGERAAWRLTAAACFALVVVAGVSAW